MKTKTLLFALLAMFALSVSAQADYSNYLKKSMEKLEAGDCEAARKMYNVYKDLSGKSVSSVEMLLNDCKVITNDTNRHMLNDKIRIGEYIYRVAFVEDGGLHGFAIYDYGSAVITDKMIKDRLLPTRSEMGIIAKNAEKLNLDPTIFYWTLDKASSDKNYFYRFSDKYTSDGYISNPRAILLIYRF